MDTSDEIERLRLKLIAKLSPEERFQRMNRLCVFGKLAMLEGLRERMPQASEKKLRIQLAENLWGKAFAAHIAKKMEDSLTR